MRSNVASNIQWLDGNLNPIAGATQQDLIPTQAGTYYVQVKDGNCSALSQPYTYYYTSRTQGQDLGLTLYPQPASQYLQVQLEKTGIYTIRIASLQGHTVYTQTLDGNATRIDLASLAAGTYIFSVQGHGASHTRRIVVQ